jgi:Flagellar hook-length control protein FliK
VTTTPGLPIATGVGPDPAATDDIVRGQVPPPTADVLVDVPARAAGSIPAQTVARDLAELIGESMRTTAQVSLTRDAASVLGKAEAPLPDAAAKLVAHQPNVPVAPRQAAEPAPPFRGAVPSPQPVVAPSLAPDTPPASMGHQLLEQTDAALARQTLLQVASLPDRVELGGSNQTTQPRWSFEIPFATPQGTAVAQFEISRDGGNDVEAAAPTRVWRARFTLDVEPAGPVHALVSLIGDKTAVRMWAERSETAAQLRAGADALSQALREAELEPGDILIGEGAPPQPKPRAGRFLDRAT